MIFPSVLRSDGQLNISLHTGIFMRWMFMAVRNLLPSTTKDPRTQR